MPFELGNKKSIGRPKGAKNKKLKEETDALLKLLTAYEKGQLIEDFNTLTPIQKIKTYESLLKYIKPALKQVDTNISNNISVLQFALPSAPIDINHEELKPNKKNNTLAAKASKIR